MSFVSITPAAALAIEKFHQVWGNRKPYPPVLQNIFTQSEFYDSKKPPNSPASEFTKAASAPDTPVHSTNSQNTKPHKISLAALTFISDYLCDTVNSQSTSDGKLYQESEFSLSNLLKGATISLTSLEPACNSYPELCGSTSCSSDKSNDGNNWKNINLKDFELRSGSNAFQKKCRPIDISWTGPDKSNDTNGPTMNQVKRQIATLLNIVVTIVSCAFAAWFAARHKPYAVRLSLSLLAALVVGIADTVLYLGYLRRFGKDRNGNRKDKLHETRVILDSWVIAPSASSSSRRSSSVSTMQTSFCENVGGCEGKENVTLTCSSKRSIVTSTGNDCVTDKENLVRRQAQKIRDDV